MNVGCHQRRKKILLTSVVVGVGEKDFLFVVTSGGVISKLARPQSPVRCPILQCAAYPWA